MGHHTKVGATVLALAIAGCSRDGPTPSSDSGSAQPPSGVDAEVEAASPETAVDAAVEAASPEAAVDAAVEAGSPEAAIDAPGADEGGIDPLSCDRDAGIVTFREGSPTITFQGCLRCRGSPAVTVSVLPNVNAPVIGVSYVCSATSDVELVRIKACVAVLDNPSTVGDEVTYCAIVDVPPDVLSSLADGSELALDGTTAFAFGSSSDVQVLPENVDYMAALPTSRARRVWLEKVCFCSAGGLTGTQELKGRLRISERSAERMVGELKLSASGTISPTTDLPQTVGLLIHFDMPIVARTH